MLEIPMFEGPTIRHTALLVGFAVMGALGLGLTLLALGGYWSWRACVACRRHILPRRRHLRRRPPHRHLLSESTGGGEKELDEQAEVGREEEAEAEEAGEKRSKIKQRLVYAVLWTWILLAGSGPLLWLVVMDYLPWWAGWLSSLALLWSSWFAFFPFFLPIEKRSRRWQGSQDEGASAGPGALQAGGYVLLGLEPMNGLRKDNEGEGEEEEEEILQPSSMSGATMTHTWGGGAGEGRCCCDPRPAVSRFCHERAERVCWRPLMFAAGMAGWFVFALSIPFVFEGICISEYPLQGAAFPLLFCLFVFFIYSPFLHWRWYLPCSPTDPPTVDFRLVRQMQSSTCAGDAPCHVYLTLPPGNISASIVVHFHNDGWPGPCGCMPTVFYDSCSHGNGA